MSENLELDVREFKMLPVKGRNTCIIDMCSNLMLSVDKYILNYKLEFSIYGMI